MSPESAKPIDVGVVQARVDRERAGREVDDAADVEVQRDQLDVLGRQHRRHRPEHREHDRVGQRDDEPELGLDQGRRAPADPTTGPNT